MRGLQTGRNQPLQSGKILQQFGDTVQEGRKFEWEITVTHVRRVLRVYGLQACKEVFQDSPDYKGKKMLNSVARERLAPGGDFYCIFELISMSWSRIIFVIFCS